MTHLIGKVAVVVGGARGIGEACVRRMLQEGAKVCFADLNAARGAATCETLEKLHPDSVHFVPCDVTVDKQIEDTFDAAIHTFGRVDICVNCAGICDEVNWRKTLEINLIGSIAVTYIAQKKMGTATGGNGGHVVLLSSTAGILPFPNVPSYVASKYGIVGFVRSIGSAEIYAGCGVRVNAICPCLVQTELLNEAVILPGSPAEMFRENIEDETHVITVDQVADAIMKLELGDYNGSCMVFTKEGIQPFDEAERHGKFLANMYAVTD